jgi:RNA polymerase sigma factor (sigma-70 family)
MKTQISFDNIEKASQPGLEGSILVMARRHVERYLSGFPQDSVELLVHAEKSRHRDYFRVSAKLVLPVATLTAHKESHDVLDALNHMFDELERELLRHIALLRQEEAWHRHEQRDELRQLKKALGAEPSTAVEAFGKLMRDLLPQLQQFVRREMAALRARGDINPGYPTPQDMADEVLARAFQRLAQRPADLDPLQWLYQITHEVLNEEARKSPKERPRDYTLEEQDEGVYRTWRPDEMLLKPRDAAPATAETPEAKLEEQDVRKYFHDVLANMPNNWRRAIWLIQAEGIPAAKVARMMGAGEEEVKRWIQLGDEYLRAQLRDAGYEVPAAGQQAGWFEPAPATESGLLEALDDVMRDANKTA